MEYKDYYKILGVEKTVGIEDLKKNIDFWRENTIQM